MNTRLSLHGKTISVSRLEGNVEGLSFAGSMTGQLGSEGHIDLVLDALDGTIGQARNLLGKLGNEKNILVKLPLDGKISLGHDGSWLHLGMEAQGLTASACCVEQFLTAKSISA